MSRVTLVLFAAAVVSLTAAGSATAGGCGCSGNSYGYAVAQPVYMQPAPQVVAVQPPPVLVQVQQPPVLVQQYVVNQGPVYSGPNLTDYQPAAYYEPRAVRTYPYMGGGYRWAGYREPAYRHHGHHRRHHWHGHGHHRHHGAPLRRYY